MKRFAPVLIALALCVPAGCGSGSSTAAGKVSSTARDQCKTSVKSVELSSEAVAAKVGTYPTGMIDDSTRPNPLVTPSDGALLRAWPTDPEYVIRYEGTGGTSYEVKAFQPDGVTPIAACSASSDRSRAVTSSSIGSGLGDVPSRTDSAACKTDLKAMQLSAEAIMAKTGSYPTAAADLDDASMGGLLKSVPPGYDYASANGTSYSITPNPPVPGCAPVRG